MLSWFVDRVLYQANPLVTDKKKYIDISGIPCMCFASASPRKVIVYVYGSGMSLASLHDSGFAQVLADDSRSVVVAPELPGYGVRAHVRHGSGSQRDNMCSDTINTVAKYLRKQGISHITIVGRSLGAGIALNTLNAYPRTCNNTSGLVLISGFKSLKAMCHRPSLRAFIEDRFCNERNIQSIPASIPTTIIHGTADELVPYDHAQTLHRRRHGSRLMTVDGMHHAPTDMEMKHIATIIANSVKDIYVLNADIIARLNDKPGIQVNAKSASTSPDGDVVWWRHLCPI